jgi:hypothetical protein
MLDCLDLALQRPSKKGKRVSSKPDLAQSVSDSKKVLRLMASQQAHDNADLTIKYSGKKSKQIQKKRREVTYEVKTKCPKSSTRKPRLMKLLQE